MTIDRIETWRTYADTAGIAARWPYTYGLGGVLVPGGLLVDGSNYSVNPFGTNYTNTYTHPCNRFRIGFEATFLATPVELSSFLHLNASGDTNAQNQIGLGCHPDGRLAVFRGDNFSGAGGETLGSTATTVSLDATVWLELDVLLRKDATGRVELRVDGVPALVLENTVTNVRLADFIDTVSLVFGRSGRVRFGAMYWGDGADGWIGPSTGARVALAAAGARQEFVRTGGASDAGVLNDLDPATYLQTKRRGGAGRFGLNGADVPDRAVRAVQVTANTRQVASSRAGPDFSGAVTLAAGGVTMAGGAARPSSGTITPGTEARHIWTLAPDGMPWTPAKLRAAEAGVFAPLAGRGFNFRATAGGAADSSYDTYVANDLYPTVRDGWTFGWDSAGSPPNASDQIGVDPRLAGTNSQANTGSQRTWRLDVPAPGRYRLRLAVGDPSAQQDQVYVQVRDGGAAPLLTINSLAGTPYTPRGYAVLDASGENSTYPIEEWPERNRPRDVQIAQGHITVTVGSPALGTAASCLMHLELVSLDAAAAAQPAPMDLVIPPYRIIRLNLLSAASPSYYGFGEIEFRSQVGVPLAFPGSGTASAAQTYFNSPAYGPDKATDGNAGSAWFSTDKAAGQWWQFDYGLGDSLTLAEVWISAGGAGAGSAPTSFTMSGSNDGVTFDTFATVASGDYALNPSQAFPLAVTNPGLRVNGLFVEALFDRAAMAAGASNRSYAFMMA